MAKEKPRTKVRVEHVFGAMENGMGGIFLRSIGLARAGGFDALKGIGLYP